MHLFMNINRFVYQLKNRLIARKALHFVMVITSMFEKNSRKKIEFYIGSHSMRQPLLRVTVTRRLILF